MQHIFPAAHGFPNQTCSISGGSSLCHPLEASLGVESPPFPWGTCPSAGSPCCSLTPTCDKHCVRLDTSTALSGARGPCLDQSPRRGIAAGTEHSASRHADTAQPANGYHIARELMPGVRPPWPIPEDAIISKSSAPMLLWGDFFFFPCGKRTVRFKGGDAEEGGGFGYLRQKGIAVPSSAAGCWPLSFTGRCSAVAVLSSLDRIWRNS